MSVLWMDMGLGKSVVTLSAFADLLASYDVRRMLVVAPRRVARDVWHAEVEQWAHLNHLTVSRMTGTRQQRLAAYRNPADIHTINRENLDWLFRGHVEERARNRFKQTRHWPWSLMVLDESQSFKNPSASRTVAASRISTFGLCDRIVELTGTPAPRSYEDLWSQIYILDHGKRLFPSKDTFLKTFFDKDDTAGYDSWTLKPGADQEIQNRLRDIVLSMRSDDYMDLPPVMYNEIKVHLTPGELKRYRRLHRTAVLELADTTVTAANAGVLVGKLLQYASGAVYTNDAGSYEILHDAKLDALCDVLDELIFSGPVLIAYNFKSDAQRIAQRLERYCGEERRWEFLRSAESLDRFSRGEVDFGIIHPGSAGHGLNSLHLSGSEEIVWYGPTNNGEHFEQLNARLAGGHRRVGKNVRVQVLLAAETADEDCMTVLKMKQFNQVGLVKALRARE